jgi:hypothetical protein
MMHGKLKKLFNSIAIFLLKGDSYAIRVAFRNRANPSIIARKLLILFQNLFIRTTNNQTPTLPANESLPFRSFLPLSFISVLAAKVPELIPSQGSSSGMPAAMGYGPKPQGCIAVPLPKLGPKFLGPYFETCWVKP